MGTDFTLGAVAGFGNSIVQGNDLNPPIPLGLPDGTEVEFLGLTFILGFNFGFS